MKPTTSICCLVLVAGGLVADRATSQVTVERGEDDGRQAATYTVRSKGEPFAVVHASAEPRPYVWPVHGPGGVEMTRNHPMGQREGEQHDHPHHQSLWFTHGAVDGFDFWHGSGKGERIVLVDSEAAATDDGAATVRCEYRWVVDGEGEDAAPRALLLETRELRFEDHGDWRAIAVVTTLRPAANAVTFGDTKEGSFALRVHPALRAEGPLATGKLSNSEGHQGKAVWGKRAKWIDDTGTIGDQTVGVAMFDHPQNLRHPTWWHARAYGLLGANPFGAHDFEKKPKGTGDFVLEKGETLELRYLVALHRGAWDRARGDRVFAAWAKAPAEGR